MIEVNNLHLNCGSIETSAYNGINATHVDGQTLVSLFHIDVGQKYEQLTSLQPLTVDQLTQIELD